MKNPNYKLQITKFRQIILDFPKQFRVGLKAAENVKVPGKFKGVIICGMGGSALPGDILEMWVRDRRIALPLYIHRDYGLPYLTDKKRLIVCISYSGNTEETITAFGEARKRKLPLTAIASGGKLVKLCQKYQIPIAKIPQGYQPRMALGFQFAALMKIMVNCGIIKDDSRNILALEKSLEPEKLKNRGEKMAKKLTAKIPIIYASERLKNLARIWKIKFNEVSKILSHTDYFPELNHNEMSGFTNPQGRFHVIILRDQDCHPRILKRIKLTAEMIKEKGVGVDIIDINGKDILFKIFSNIILGDWVSYYLALAYRVDPILIKLQEEFKKKMKNK